MGTVNRDVRLLHRYQRWTNSTMATNSRYVTYIRSRTGGENPRWREKIANHQNAGTNLGGTYETVDLSLLRTKKVSAATYRVEGDFLGHQYDKTWDADVTGSIAEQRATMQAYKQIRASQRQFSGGVFLGELQETLRMLRNPAKGILDGLSSYLKRVAKAKRDRDIRNAAARSSGRNKGRKIAANEKTFKDVISQSWLEGSFGWLPLLHDLEDARKAYNTLVESNNEDRFEKIRAVGKNDAMINSSQEIIAPVGNFNHLIVKKFWQEAVFIIRGEVRVKPELTLADKGKLFGLAPNEFMPTVWELIPWSFLVDYFVNIGDVLDASTTDVSGVTWMIGTSVKLQIKEYNVRALPKAQQPDANLVQYIEGNQATLRRKKRTVSRSASYQLSAPSVLFRLPTLPLQQANMLALFAQATSIHAQKYRF